MFRRRVMLVLALGALLTTAGCAGPPSERPSIIQLPAAPTVYFYGDSWTHGASAAPGQGFPEVVGRALGWQVEVGPDGSAAGYTNTFWAPHPVFPTAVQRIPRIHADLIVLEGGLNDEIAAEGGRTEVAGAGRYTAAVGETIQLLRQRAGGVPVVLLGPAPPSGSASLALRSIDRMEAAAAARAGAAYISPIQEGWLNRRNAGQLVDATTNHPNTAGHAYYGGRLASALARLTTADGGPAQER